MDTQMMERSATLGALPLDAAPVDMPRTRFEQALRVMRQQGQIESAVLATLDGLPIAIVPASHDAGATITMIEIVRGVINRIQHQLHLATVDEVSLIGGDGQRLVCRYFSYDGEEFILAIVTPPEQHYRRVTTQAIHSIKRVLSGHGRNGRRLAAMS